MEADEAEPLDIGSQAEPGNLLYHSDTTGNDINYWRVLLVNPPLPYWVIDQTGYSNYFKPQANNTFLTFCAMFCQSKFIAAYS